MRYGLICHESITEKQASLIWNIADILRGGWKQYEYQNVILPLVVLKRIDSVLSPNKQKVIQTTTQMAGKVSDSGESMLDPMGVKNGGGKLPDEMERLSLIIKEINSTYGLPEGMEIDGMALVTRVKERQDVQKAIANNPRGAAKTHFASVFEEELMKMYSERADFYKTLDDDVTLKESMSEKIFDELYSNNRLK